MELQRPHNPLCEKDFVAFYKQTILGPLWFLLQLLFTTIVFTVIFGRIA
jgi:lipopolysaccharide transport system permease protein